MKTRQPFPGLIVAASAAVAFLCSSRLQCRRSHRPKAPGWDARRAGQALRPEGQAAVDVHDRTAQGRHGHAAVRRTSGTSTRPRRASSPSRPTRRSWPTPATWPGTWAATSGCCKARTSRASIPSLQRQAVLNMAYGLYEVVPGKIYQVRGFDLANISFIKGDTGWIVFDPLTAKETARAALEFINEKLGKRPVVGVVYSHSHVDHFGGVRGVVDEADVVSGKVKVIAPEGLHAGGDRRERVRRQRHVAAHAVLSTRSCCRATRSVTSTSRSARTWRTATSG